MASFEIVTPTHFAQAKSAYERLLRTGIGSDVELSRDLDYRSLLSAGMAIRRVGGASAVRDVSTALVASVAGAELDHFERLWDGLMTDFTHH